MTGLKLCWGVKTFCLAIVDSPGIPGVGNVTIAGYRIAGLLVESIPHVRILALSKSAPRDVGTLIKVVPGHAARGCLEVGASAGAGARHQVIGIGVVIV